jgi:hypothetical protein
VTVRFSVLEKFRINPVPKRVSLVRSGVDSGIGDIDGGEDGGSATGVPGTVTVIGSGRMFEPGRRGG